LEYRREIKALSSLSRICLLICRFAGRRRNIRARGGLDSSVKLHFLIKPKMLNGGRVGADLVGLERSTGLITAQAVPWQGSDTTLHLPTRSPKSGMLTLVLLCPLGPERERGVAGLHLSWG
jgi:hypothetical protein